MKENQRIYIKGDSERGDEVIKTLIDLGGKNINGFEGNLSDTYYFINPNGYIAISTPTLLPYIKEFYKEVKLPRWKPKYNELYYSVSWLGRVMSDKWYGTYDDELSYQFGNIFKTRKEAELVRDKIKKLLNH